MDTTQLSSFKTFFLPVPWGPGAYIYGAFILCVKERVPQGIVQASDVEWLGPEVKEEIWKINDKISYKIIY